MFDLSGKTALVTGASGGLGGAIARALHQQGATVALSGTRRDALQTLAIELGERSHVCPCDLADAAAVEALVPAAEAAMGSLDILVNNAGVTRDNLFMRMKDAEWETVLVGQPHRRLPPVARGPQRHDAAAVWPHRQHHIDRRRHRQPGPRQLRRRQGGRDRHVEVARRGSREPRHHGQLHRAWLHRQPDDRRAQRQTARVDPRQRADGSSSAPVATSALRRSIWPAAKPPTSPARRSMSTAVWL